MTATASTRVTKAKRRLPILEGILPFDRARLPTEVIAGATLAALAMPEVMGYSKIAEMPVITGLVHPRPAHAGLRDLRLVTPSRGRCRLGDGCRDGHGPRRHRGGRRARVAAMGRHGRPVGALMCGVFMIAARLLRLGFIANFLSHSVLIGFLTGVGIQVALGQFGGLFGVSEGSGTTLQKFGNALQAIADGEASLPTLAVSTHRPGHHRRARAASTRRSRAPSSRWSG